jgi:hypothetical protein
LQEATQREFSRYGLDWEFAWEVARCDPYLVGAAGEIGWYQLHPRGVLPSFYAAGYTDPYDAYQQIEFVARYVSENSWGEWTCAR